MEAEHFQHHKTLFFLIFSFRFHSLVSTHFTWVTVLSWDTSAARPGVSLTPLPAQPAPPSSAARRDEASVIKGVTNQSWWKRRSALISLRWSPHLTSPHLAGPFTVRELNTWLLPGYPNMLYSYFSRSWKQLWNISALCQHSQMITGECCLTQVTSELDTFSASSQCFLWKSTRKYNVQMNNGGIKLNHLLIVKLQSLSGFSLVSGTNVPGLLFFMVESSFHFDWYLNMVDIWTHSSLIVDSMSNRVWCMWKENKAKYVIIYCHCQNHYV